MEYPPRSVSSMLKFVLMQVPHADVAPITGRPKPTFGVKLVHCARALSDTRKKNKAANKNRSFICYSFSIGVIRDGAPTVLVNRSEPFLQLKFESSVIFDRKRSYSFAD